MYNKGILIITTTIIIIVIISSSLSLNQTRLHYILTKKSLFWNSFALYWCLLYRVYIHIHFYWLQEKGSVLTNSWMSWWTVSSKNLDTGIAQLLDAGWLMRCGGGDFMGQRCWLYPMSLLSGTADTRKILETVGQRASTPDWEHKGCNKKVLIQTASVVIKMSLVQKPRAWPMQQQWQKKRCF